MNKNKAFLRLLLLALIGFLSMAWWGLPAYHLSVLTQVFATAIILASLRILVGTAGVISFGHALYVGMGAYGAAHLMLWAQQASFFIPLFLIPLAGGLTGLLVAVFAGWLSTRRLNPIYMAMVTLALAELVHALAQVWPAVFGGEAGLQVDRTAGNFFGLDFADERLMFILALGYAGISLWLMHKLVRTSLGQWLCATREDAVRVACLGMYPQRILYTAFLISGFFAGIGGALLMLAFEAAQPSMLSVLHSGSYLMFTYLGGLGHVLGSFIGAAAQVFGVVGLPALTPASELYIGLLFIYAVLNWPWGVVGALSGFIQQHKVEPIQQGKAKSIWLNTSTHLCSVMSIICVVELAYRIWDPFTQKTILQSLAANMFWAIALIVFLLLAVQLRRLRQRKNPQAIMQKEGSS